MKGKAKRQPKAKPPTGLDWREAVDLLAGKSDDDREQSDSGQTAGDGVEGGRGTPPSRVLPDTPRPDRGETIAQFSYQNDSKPKLGGLGNGKKISERHDA